MTQDYRPKCFWCQKRLNKKEREYYKRTNEKLCKKCFTWFKHTMNNAGFKVDMEERYP